MNRVLLYDEKLERCEGAFIEPYGNIIILSNSHEEFAKNYCVDICKLNVKELNLFKLWVEFYEKNNISYNNIYCDYLVQVLGFDKVEKVKRNTITTASHYPYTRFYNYYLMDWNVEKTPKLNYDYVKNVFVANNNFYNYNLWDRENEREILDIKSRVLKMNRSIFFK